MRLHNRDETLSLRDQAANGAFGAVIKSLTEVYDRQELLEIILISGLGCRKLLAYVLLANGNMDKSPTETKPFHMYILETLGVSSLSASLAHVPHHPLYTLKSQMMFHGKKFKFLSFLERSIQTKGTFLFQGMICKKLVVLLTSVCGFLNIILLRVK